MISLYNLSEVLDINYNNIKEKQWFSIDKKEKNNHINKLETEIIFRLGVESKYTYIKMFSKLRDILCCCSKDIEDENNEKIYSKYNLVIPLQIEEPDTFYLYTQNENNNINKCLITKASQKTCIGFNKQIKTSVINSSIDKNKYLLVAFTNSPIKDSLSIKSNFLYNVITENTIDVNIVNKKEFEFVTVNDIVECFTSFIESYNITSKHMYLSFENTVLEPNINFFDDELVIESPYLNCENIYKHLVDTNFYVYTSNNILTRQMFSDNFYTVNKETNNSIELYILELVKQYCKSFTIDYNNINTITINISDTDVFKSIITVPLCLGEKQNENSSLIFIHANNKDINNVRICKNSPNNVYFKYSNNSHMKVNKNNKNSFCYINAYFNQSEYNNKDIPNQDLFEYTETQLTCIKDTHNVCNINDIDKDESYENIISEIQSLYKEYQAEDLKNVMLQNELLLLSNLYFDEISNDDEILYYDILSYNNVLNKKIIEKIANSKDDFIKKRVYLNIAPKICEYFQLTKINVIKSEIHNYKGSTMLSPPINCLYIVVLLDNKNDLIITSNFCMEFSPYTTTGSILVLTYKKNVNIKSNYDFSCLVYTIQIT